MENASLFLLMAVSILSAADDSKAEERKRVTVDDVAEALGIPRRGDHPCLRQFAKSMLATPGMYSSRDHENVEEALQASDNRFKDLMKDAPEVRDRAGRVFSSLSCVDEPGTYYIPSVFCTFNNDGSCLVEGGAAILTLPGTSYSTLRAGQAITDCETETKVLLFPGENIYTEGWQFIETFKKYLPKNTEFSRASFLMDLENKGIQVDKDQAEYLLYAACKEAVPVGFTRYKVLEGLFLKAMKRIADGKDPELTPELPNSGSSLISSDDSE
jgi:hypothetical protein